jgi:hypothetical protein
MKDKMNHSLPTDTEDLKADEAYWDVMQRYSALCALVHFTEWCPYKDVLYKKK